MYKYIPTGIKFKIFVKESNSEHACKKFDTEMEHLPASSLTGNEAKEYYENILKETSLSSGEKQSSVKSKPSTKFGPRSAKAGHSKRFKDSDLLWMAQNNDVKNLNIFFAQNKDYDINLVDNFGWTPLMCAACSGAEAAVKILLENGADPNKCDKFGNTALKLAWQKNFPRVLKILQNNNKPDVTGDEITLKESAENFYCSICKENFTINKSKHESSTLHLFNSRLKTRTFYGIPESNKGFQLLLQEGWNKEKGLGLDETGRKFPIKAVMKKDRTGIGAPPPSNKKKRETQHCDKYESKNRNIYKKWRNKDFERNFRSEFS